MGTTLKQKACLVCCLAAPEDRIAFDYFDTVERAVLAGSIATLNRSPLQMLELFCAKHLKAYQAALVAFHNNASFANLVSVTRDSVDSGAGAVTRDRGDST